ncbi:LOW QUALITY PROTEIN: trafficking protein particle complex subunit 11 gry [Dermatophagoides farinae]|uniref:LOW QUALITY PROTEIN: trafficking protein particle complex subunit 11 gry n=1 Tax=Dermatophagoides farinae TaxID=6954 RepID=UPI003F5EA428
MMNNIPAEISVNPVPYISLLGLDAANNPIHSIIWNSFAINRSADRPVLYYKLLPIDYRFPSSKNRRSYDRYIPAGIIKTKWLNKHLFEIPSVVVVFVSLQNWQQLDRHRLIDEINSLKMALINRQIKIVVILLQSEPISSITYNHQDNHQDVNQINKDQATRLCEECDINPKSLFIIPVQDEQSIPGYVHRIESTLNELVKAHFSSKVKQIKSYRDQLNKITQNYLFVRHEFKLGFYHEIRQIYNQALVHYKNAYASLMELRQSSINLIEIKNVATVLNYKIIRLSFYLNIPLDAISYFRKHIDIFHNRFADDERIEFEHYAWLANQFYLFAELFDMSISMLHLSPSSSQNPGVYYFESAMYTIKRRESSQRSSSSSLSSLNHEEIAHVERALQNGSEFIGQLSWYRPGELNDDSYVKIFHHIERTTDLAPFLIKLLVNVLNQIKKFKKPRFMRFVMYLIGREYFLQGNYNDALNYFGNILGYYREERWKPIHRRLAQLALQSAYLCMDYVSVIKCSFEYISNDTIDPQRKISLLKSLLQFLQLEFQSFITDDTDVEMKINSKTLSEAEMEWPRKLMDIEQNGLPSNIGGEILINADHELNFMKCKVTFDRRQYTIEDDIRIKVAIFNQLIEQLDPIDIQIRFEIPEFDKQCQLLSPQGEQQQSILYSNSLNLFEFRLRLRPSNDRQYCRIKISEIAVILKSKISVRFQWLYTSTMLTMATTTTPAITLPISSISDDSIKFNKIDNRIDADLLDLESRLQLIGIEMKQRLFRNENASIRIRLRSKERHVIGNLKLLPKIMTQQQQQQQQQVAISATEINIDNTATVMNIIQDTNCQWSIRLVNQTDAFETIPSDSAGILITDQLEPSHDDDGDDDFIIDLILCSRDLGLKILSFEFSYDLMMKTDDDDVQSIPITKNFQTSINVVEPFQFLAKVANFANPDTSNIRLDEPFRLNCHLRLPTNGDEEDDYSSSSSNNNQKDDDSSIIEIDSISSNFDENIKIISQKMTKLPALLSKDSTTPIDSYLMNCIKSEQKPQPLGSWSIRWHRKSETTTAIHAPILSETTFPLPAITMIPAIIYVELFVPDKLYARNPFMAKYKITSRLDVDVSLEIQIGQAEYFMIAGNRQVKIILPSRSIIEQVFIFFPLTCGQLVLPKLDIMVHPNGYNPIKIDYIGQMILPTVFVLPKLRTNIFVIITNMMMILCDCELFQKKNF